MDQAAELRDIFAKKEETAKTAPSRTSRVITVTSGKGGVGKTNFTVNLAIYLSGKGKRVVILDADFGLANIEVLFGIVPKLSLADILLGDKTMDDVLTDGPNGIKFVSGGSGLGELANITEAQMSYLLENFNRLDQISDIILIDTGAGISKSVINFVKAGDETIIVTTPEPTSVTDAYALIKTIKEERSRSGGGTSTRATPSPDFKIVVNRVESAAEGADIFGKLKMVAERFLGVNLAYLGAIPYDSALVKAVKKQQPVTTAFPQSMFVKNMGDIGDKLLNIDSDEKKAGVKNFMKRLINIFGS